MAAPPPRQFADLVGIHPTNQPPSPPISAAASRSLDARWDEGTAWSLAWKMAMRARLHQGEAAGRLLDLFLRRAIDIAPGPTGGRWRGGLYRTRSPHPPPSQLAATPVWGPHLPRSLRKPTPMGWTRPPPRPPPRPHATGA